MQLFDRYDKEVDGFLNPVEVAGLAGDQGLDATFLDAYVTCLHGRTI
jgi:hypothetical protein